MKTFSSFGQFAAHLARLAAEGPAVTHHLADHCAQQIAERAREKLGKYQDESGPYPAWAELADETKADRVRQGYSENEPLLRSGELRDSISHSADGPNAAAGSTSELAPAHEFGTSRIPPRPFLGPAALESKEEIEVAGVRTVAAWVSGREWERPPAIDSDN